MANLATLRPPASHGGSRNFSVWPGSHDPFGLAQHQQIQLVRRPQEGTRSIGSKQPDACGREFNGEVLIGLCDPQMLSPGVVTWHSICLSTLGGNGHGHA